MRDRENKHEVGWVERWWEGCGGVGEEEGIGSNILHGN